MPKNGFLSLCVGLLRPLTSGNGIDLDAKDGIVKTEQTFKQ